MESSTADGKRTRAQKACQFCHQRKMKCNNNLPSCANCLTKGQNCTYAQGPKKPRPSNERISRLEEENQQLHASLASGTTKRERQGRGSTQKTMSSTRKNPQEDHADTLPRSKRTDGKSTAKEGSSLSTSTVRADATQSTEFHGPSSPMFDEDDPSTGQTRNVDTGEHTLEPPSDKLMANAATQRTCIFAILDFPAFRPKIAYMDPSIQTSSSVSISQQIN